jgi:hypothetical protein
MLIRKVIASDIQIWDIVALVQELWALIDAHPEGKLIANVTDDGCGGSFLEVAILREETPAEAVERIAAKERDAQQLRDEKLAILERLKAELGVK